MRLAIVHDYLVDAGGAERVVLALHDQYPAAPIFTSVYDPRATFPEFRALAIRTSFLQLPFVRKSNYKYLLPFFPGAFESFDLSGFDVIISSASAFGKGARIPRGALHICYCHTPTRFIWRYADYIAQEQIGSAQRLFIRAIVGGLKSWDYAAAQRVHHFIANSQATAERIRENYQRDSTIIHPPVDVEHFALSTEIADHYLLVSRLAPYKRIDLAVEAFNRLGLPLKIVGAGAGEARLRRMARGNIEFLGHVPQAQLARLLAQCRALVLPGVEDFGIAVLEANAAGRPVIAYGASGALETVIDGVTGVFFREQTAEALAEIIAQTDVEKFDARVLRTHAERFSKARFKTQVAEFVFSKWDEFKIQNSKF